MCKIEFSNKAAEGVKRKNGKEKYKGPWEITTDGTEQVEIDT